MSTKTIFKKALFYKTFTDTPNYFKMERFNDLMFIYGIISTIIYLIIGLKSFNLETLFAYVVLGVFFNVLIINMIAVLVAIFAPKRTGNVLKLLTAWLSIAPSSMFILLWFPFVFKKIIENKLDLKESVDIFNTKNVMLLVLVQLIWTIIDFWFGFRKNIRYLTEHH